MCALAAQQFEDFFEFLTDLLDDLLTLARIDPRGVSGKPLASSPDREAFFVQQRADLPNDQDILALIVATVPAPLDRCQLRKFLFPIAKNVGFDRAKVAHLTDGEVTLAGYGRKFVVISGFQHKLPLATLVFVPGEMSQPVEP